MIFTSGIGPINERTLNSLPPSPFPSHMAKLHPPSANVRISNSNYSLFNTFDVNTWVACYVIFKILGRWWSSAAKNSSPPFASRQSTQSTFCPNKTNQSTVSTKKACHRRRYRHFRHSMLCTILSDLRTELQTSTLNQQGVIGWHMLSSKNLDNWRNEFDGTEIETTLVSYRKIGFKGNHTDNLSKFKC